MKIAVYGLWHLGSVTAACLASVGHEVLACDPEENTIEKLKNGEPPIYEPKLKELIDSAIKKQKIEFTCDISKLSKANIVWVAFDTPVDDEDHADVKLVMKQVENIFPYLQENVVILISSQLPVGSVATLKKCYQEKYPSKNIHFACSPENLRLGKAVDVFLNPDRIIVGVDSDSVRSLLQPLFSSISKNIIWMSCKSAEVTKHALNAFLATSVVFINELATICEATGADAYEVEQGLKSEVRIGPKAYLHPGSAFAGGTLARDINYLLKLAKDYSVPSYLFNAVLQSNNSHKNWTYHKLKQLFLDLKNKKIGLLGLTYKAETNTLRRSAAVELNNKLQQEYAFVLAYDPLLKELPADINLNLVSSFADATEKVDALVFNCFKEEFKNCDPEKLLTAMNQPIIIDPDGVVSYLFAEDKRFKYFSVGK